MGSSVRPCGAPQCPDRPAMPEFFLTVGVRRRSHQGFSSQVPAIEGAAWPRYSVWPLQAGRLEEPGNCDNGAARHRSHRPGVSLTLGPEWLRTLCVGRPPAGVPSVRWQSRGFCSHLLPYSPAGRPCRAAVSPGDLPHSVTFLAVTERVSQGKVACPAGQGLASPKTAELLRRAGIQIMGEGVSTHAK